MPGWRGNLLVTSLRGATPFCVVLSADGSKATNVESLFREQYGRLHDVLVGPGGEIYLATSTLDGRGRPASNDDRILRVVP